MSDTAQCGRCGAPVEVGALFCARCGLDVTAPHDENETLAATTGGTPVAQGPARSTMRQMLREATLGEYEILDELGRGGMATVFRAHDIALDRKVAIKVMAPHLLEGEGMAERFKLEARTAAQLSHPHIIPIYAVRESAATLFFVMKYVEGRTLDGIIAKMGPLPIPMAKEILVKVGSALGYAHRRGVVHRDVKPGNIMIDEEGTPIVTDFGIAKVTESTGLTMTGTTIGTPSYMSPEQCEAKEVTGASDQYSLGVVAFQMLTGKLPFEGDSAVTVMYKHCHEDLPPLKDFRPDCPPEVVQTIERMVAKKPGERWPSLEAAIQKLGMTSSTRTHLDPIHAELLKAAREGDLERLAELSTGGGSLTPVDGAAVVKPGRRRRRTAGVAAVALLVVAAGALAVLQPWAPEETAALGEDTGLAGTPADGAGVDGRQAGGAGVDGGVVGDGSGATDGGARPSGEAEPDGDPREPAVAARDDGTVVASATDIEDAPATAQEEEGPTSEALPRRLVVRTVSLSGLPSTLEPGGGAQLSALAVDQDGKTIPRTTVDDCDGLGWSRCGVTWASSDDGVARVGADGSLRAVGPGTATISATVNGITDYADVTVTEARVASVSVTPADLRMAVGDQTAVVAEARSESGSALRDRATSWRSSDTNVARVAEAGVVEAVGVGTATVTADVEGVTGEVAVTVEPDARSAADGLVAEYARAVQAGDIPALRQIYPSIPAEEVEGVRALSQFRELRVGMVIDSFEPEDDRATAELSGTYQFVDRAAGETRLDRRFQATFERRPEGWRITRWVEIRR